MDAQRKTQKSEQLPELVTLFHEDDFEYCMQQTSRRMRAMVANMYVTFGFSWAAIRKDPRSPHYTTLQNLQCEPEFVAVLDKVRPALAARAKDTITKLMQDSQSDVVKLKSAQYILEAHEPETYDPGVRRQMRANQGTWINSLLQASLPDSLTRTAGSLDPAGTAPALDAPLSDNCPITLLIGQSDPVPFPDEIDAESKPVLEKLDIEEESKPRTPCGNSSGLGSPPAQGAEPFADGTDAGHPPHTFSQKTKNRKKP